LTHPTFGGSNSVKALLENGVYSFLFVCQALIKHKLENKVQLLYLYPAKPGESLPCDEAMKGFVNALRLEHPKFLCKTVEVQREDTGSTEILEAVSAELLVRIQDATAVRYGGKERSIKKLKAFDLEETQPLPPAQPVSLKE